MLEVELRVLEGKQQGKTIPLHVRQFLIGREQDCHLRPNSDLVSRHHCVFTLDDFALRLRDLGSTNGTLVNGERIQGQVVLKAGDHVSVGKLSFEIVISEVARAATPQAVKAGPPATNIPAAEAPALPTAPDVASSETVANITDTVELPATAPQDDTAILDSFPAGMPAQPAAAQQPAFLPPGGYPQQAYGMPPGYPMPGYAPGYPAGYPGGYPGYPPAGYGAPPGYMPPGYSMQPMMPAQGYGMPQAPEAQPASSSNRVIEAPPVVLPDPSQTGAKAPPAPPPPAPVAEGQAADPATTKNPSDAAADIIRSHRNRRPT